MQVLKYSKITRFFWYRLFLIGCGLGIASSLFLFSAASIFLSEAASRPNLDLEKAQTGWDTSPRGMTFAGASTLQSGIILNEIAWGGTAASSSDEWLELYNPLTQTVVLTGWVITSTNGLSINLNGSIPPGGYFLLERTDDNTVSDVTADLIYTGSLSNGGDTLFLSNGIQVVDTVNLTGGDWPGGSGNPDYVSLERIDPLQPDRVGNWASNDQVYWNGLDKDGNPINGTPRQPNSTTYSALTPTPTATPTSMSTPTVSPTSTSSPSPTPADTPTSTATSMATPSATPTPSPVVTATFTDTPTPPSPTSTPVDTPTPTPSASATSTSTPSSTWTAVPTETPTPTPTLTPTATPTSTLTETPLPSPTPTSPSPQNGIILNEVAWGGTAASSSDEWLELHNTLTQTVMLTGWVITSTNGLSINLSGSIAPGGYFLLERTDDTAISDIAADQTYSGSLPNNGDTLFLSNGVQAVDTVNLGGGGWPAGSGSPDYLSLERIDPLQPDGSGNWASNDQIHRNGLDKDNNPINGTPGQPNSTTYPAPTSTPTFIPQPTLTHTSTLSPTPTATALPSPTSTSTTPQSGVILNEIAWGGTAASSSDEWLELHNTLTQTVVLTGWAITSTNGLSIDLSGSIAPGGYFLLERTDDTVISDIAADQTYSGSLPNDGDTLFLSNGVQVIDTVNLGGGSWPGGSGSPDYLSMERIDPLKPDEAGNWAGNDQVHRHGLDAAGHPINGTPRQPNSTTYPPPVVIPLLISELLYDGLTPGTEGDEFVEVCNPSDQAADLTGYKLGDEESAGAGEGMYRFSAGEQLAPQTCLVVAKNAAHFTAQFGKPPDFEVLVTGDGYSDTLTVPNMPRYTAWGKGSWALTNHQDEFLILGPADQILDAVAYRNGDYALLNLQPQAAAAEPFSLQRTWPLDDDWMAADFFRDHPTPGQPSPLPTPLHPPLPTTPLPDGMQTYLGRLNAHSTFTTGDGPPNYLFAQARARGFQFLAVNDPGETITGAAWQKTGDWAAEATSINEFAALRGVAWQTDTVQLTIFGSDDPLHPGHPSTPTLIDLHTYLVNQPASIAQLGLNIDETFFQTHPPLPQFALQTIALDSTGTDLDLSTLMRRWEMGWRVAPVLDTPFQAPDWGLNASFWTGVIAPELGQEALLAALRARRLFATTDANLSLAFRAGDHWQGAEIDPAETLPVSVYLTDAEGEQMTLTLYDRALPLAETTLTAPAVWEISLTPRSGHYYWLKGVQPDGDLVVTAPLWVRGEPEPETILIHEFLPNPGDTDWNGDGVGDSQDEWIELFNPGDYPVSLAGWTLADESDRRYIFPNDALIAAGGYYLLHRQESKIALNNREDLLILRRADDSISDVISHHDDPGKGITICRPPDDRATWWTRCLPSLSAANIVLDHPAPLELKIYDAKRVTEGAWVQVRGSVTVPPGRFSKNVMYIQDSGHGIRVKLPSKHELAFEVGDRVEVVGFLDLFKAEWEIDVKGRDSWVKDLGEQRMIAPLPINSGLLSEGYEGLLVQLNAPPTTVEARKRHFWVDDGTGAAQVFIYGPTRIKRRGLDLTAPTIVVGVVNQRADDNSASDGYRISPRFQWDIKQQPLATTPPATPTVTPVAPSTPTPPTTPVAALPVANPAEPPPLRINEVAWGGTQASSSDEWIELYNPTGEPVSLTGWRLSGSNGLEITLDGVIIDYYLLERTDDNTVADIPADQLYRGSLPNDGMGLFLRYGDQIVDAVNGAGGAWPGGSAGPDYLSMARQSGPQRESGVIWGSNNGVQRNGLDADGHAINGTPGQPNAPTVITVTESESPAAPTPPPGWPTRLPETGIGPAKSSD